MLKSFFYLLNVIIGKPLLAGGKLIGRSCILPVYKTTLAIKRKLDEVLAPVKNKILFPFNNRQVVHLIIIILTVSIVMLNTKVQETRAEGFGNKTLLFALFSADVDYDYDLITETLDASDFDTATNYTDQQLTAVGSQLGLSDVDIRFTEDESVTTLSQGGSALIKPEISSISASKKHRDQIVNHVVQSGETVSSIAAAYDLTTNTLLWANNLSSYSYIKPGQTLKIPPTDGLVYKIAKGDTLKKIADKYKGDVDAIVEFNNLSDAGDITVGDTIMIPGGKPEPVRYVSPVRVVDVTPATASGGLMLWPTTTRRISQYFGHLGHTGLDIDGDFGDPVWAAESGVVIKSLCQTRGYGCHVMIDHGGGIVTLYGHFQKIYVSAGDQVSRGQVLGEEGSTGYSTGAHLHFEVRVSGRFANPLSYIR